MSNENEKEHDEREEYEEKKKYLTSYLRACRRIDNLKEQLSSLQEVEQCAKTQRLSAMPKGGSGQQDLAVLMERLEELRTKIHKKILEAQKIRLDIEDTISGIEDDVEQKVLRLRYIEGLMWEKIGLETGYNERQARRIHKKAIKNLKMSANVRFKCDNM
ncbi:MAG: hypothetical protein NC293_09840 [Roseburia sp.]|nr:hypothetical protein [Roseburia sp.]